MPRQIGYSCDECGKSWETDKLPYGWYELSWFDRGWHRAYVCEPACAIKYFQRKQEEVSNDVLSDRRRNQI
jgi:hypothetical protein